MTEHTVRSVWKYSVPIDGQDHKVEMPAGADILHVDLQDEVANPFGIGLDLQFWAEVEPEWPKTARTFRAFGTGHSITHDSYEYRGTVLARTLGLVFHLYELVV